jgi:hypothetical protein
MTGPERLVSCAVLEFEHRVLLKKLRAAVAEEPLTSPGVLSRLANIHIAIAAMDAVLATPFPIGEV